MKQETLDVDRVVAVGELDRLIHEPARLAIMTVLSSVRAADFVLLRRATGLTKGNLSSHLAKLERAGQVEIAKRFVDKRPTTTVELTPAGRERVADHWRRLDRLRRRSETVAPSSSAGPS